MKIKLHLLFLMAVCFVGISANAQDTLGESIKPPPYFLKQKKITVAVQPLQLFNWGLRHDFEIRLGNGPGWLQFGLTGYFNNFEDDIDNPRYHYDGRNFVDRNWFEFRLREPISKLTGYGLDVNYKRFVNPSRTVYIATGLAYARFNIKYLGLTWKDYIEDELLYHAYVLDFRTQEINRWGVNTYFGYQPAFRRLFLFDLFWGLGWRSSFSDSNKPSFDRHMLSYGYTGIVFLTGVRIGFGLR